MTCVSRSPAGTQRLGRRLGERLGAGSVLALLGELGCGKTVFTRGVCMGLGVTGRAVTSPTFVLVNEYRGRMPVFHMDLSRITGGGAVLDMGLGDYLARAEEGVIIIEWAERAESLLPQFLKVSFEVVSGRERRLTFADATGGYGHALSGLGLL